MNLNQKAVIGLVVGVVVGLPVLAALDREEEKTRTPQPAATRDPGLEGTPRPLTPRASTPKVEDIEITPAMVVDLILPTRADQRQWCRSVETLGFDLALTAFAESYGEGKDPSAEAVFLEALARC